MAGTIKSSIESLLLQSCVWILCSMQGFFITLRPDFQDPRLRRRSPLPSPGPAFWTPFVRARWRKYYLLPKMKTRQDKMKTTRKKLPLHLPTNPPSELFLSSRLTLGRSWSALQLPLLYSKASKASLSASSTWPVVLCSDAHAVGDVPWSTLHSLGNPQLFSCLQHPGLKKGKTSFGIWNKKTPQKSDKHFIWIKDQPPWSLLWGMSCGRRSLVWYWSTARPDVDLD